MLRVCLHILYNWYNLICTHNIILFKQSPWLPLPPRNHNSFSSSRRTAPMSTALVPSSAPAATNG